jgi:hypothetical protein
MLIYALTAVLNFLIDAEDGVINYNSSNEEEDSKTKTEGSSNDKITPT